MPDIASGGYPLVRNEFLLNGQTGNTTTFRESLSGGRLAMGSDLAALTTQIMTSVAVPVQTGDVISNITFMSGATAAGTPTNWWFAIYDDSATPALLGQTADQLTAAWAAKTAKTVALATPVTVTRPTVYYAAIMVKATTVPTLYGATAVDATAVGAVLTGQKVLARTSGSALTTTAPATIASPTTVATVPYCALT